MEIIKIIVVAIFVNNIVLSQFLGICPFLGVSNKVNTSLGMGAAVTFVMLIASIVVWLLQYGVLVPLNIGYMQTIVFILVIAALVQMVEIILKKSQSFAVSGIGGIPSANHNELCGTGGSDHAGNQRIRTVEFRRILRFIGYRLYTGPGIVRRTARTPGVGGHPQSVQRRAYCTGNSRHPGDGLYGILRTDVVP